MIKWFKWNDKNNNANQQSLMKKTTRKKNSWKNQYNCNKNKKKNHEQLMNWKYINNQKTEIFKQKCWKKKLCFHCKKKKYQVRKCRILQNQMQKSAETQAWIIITTELCEKKWCQMITC